MCKKKKTVFNAVSRPVSMKTLNCACFFLSFVHDIVQLRYCIPSRERLVALYAFQFRAKKRKISFSSVRAL